LPNYGCNGTASRRSVERQGRKMNPNLKLHVSHQQVMTPQLLQSIRLLQLSALELEQEVRQAMETNVMLEEPDLEEGQNEAEPAVASAAMQPEPQQESPPVVETEVPVSGCDVAAGDRVDADFDWSSAEAWSGGEPGEDCDPIEARTAAPANGDARMQALEQLRLLVRDAAEARLVIALIERIDDNGYLEQPLETILAELPPEYATCLADLEAALRLVQSVEPTGFGARSLRECLLLQLAELPPATPALDAARLLVETQLERLGGDAAAVLAGAGIDARTGRAALALIRSLEPRPGASLCAAVAAVEPDVLVNGSGTAWKVELNPATLPRVRVNSLYERLLSTRAAHRGMREQLQEARWLVHGLQMRHETLLKTARAIFARQCNFLRSGEEGMLPLTLREVAQQIGMHESTVCRVVSNKFVLTPWGVYPLKAFFPSQIARTEGETSGTAVRAMIRRIIDGESRATPLCDGAIAALLARGGVRVARRTVAKYREAMKIAPASARVRPGAAPVAMAG
jgi:RNA polymerase sigma-54 factor